ncbi:ABC transporter E family member 2 [Morella rubra]|uniref:ABC transporter E family member 2 n=1 Tax=Morella rubra TaxID=262757 RepID=A0A6A1WNJ1_9ROSI|nr:ABC transporter E family member 2 [Morella rubra]
MAERLTRIAIVSSDRCKPKKCRQECKKSCPVVKTGKLCIEVTSASKIAFISEELCIGCGICVKKCPFEAIQIINLPKDLDKDTTHRYGPNTFKLHRLREQDTALTGYQSQDLGKFLAWLEQMNPPDWQEILTYFRGSELQNYFTRILEDDLKAIIKPQYVDHIPKAVQGNVGQVLDQKDEKDMKSELCADLELNQVIERNVGDLSGGELQRFAIAVVAVQNAEIYMFDEPSSYLDVKQRLKAAQVIRSLLRPHSYVIVVEHDLSVLDYLSDFICCLYGKPGAYGVVTLPFSVREGINIFLAGFVPTENLRFRDESLTFKVAETPQESAEEIETYARYKYPTMSKTQGNFRLRVLEGEFTDSQIVVMLGENGTGKTTFIRMLAGLLKPDTIEGSDVEIPEFNVSYKPQKISPKFQSTVRHLLHQKIRDSYMHPQFVSDVMKPLLIEQLMDQEVVNLSGGELQRVALCLCLGKPADIYLIDEPSAYLDSEQRIVASKVIKRFILHAKKTAFVVEHDFIMATYLADRVIVYEGKPSIDCTANCPQSLLTGMNLFLSHLDITFRRDPTNFRPRINKLDSTKDREQKSAGSYYYLDD